MANILSKVCSRVWSYLVAIKFFVMSFGQDSNKLAQMGYFLAGVVCADWAGPWGCLIFFGAWVLPKEAVLDPRPPEKAPFLWDGAIDMGFYCLGMGVGLVKHFLW